VLPRLLRLDCYVTALFTFACRCYYVRRAYGLLTRSTTRLATCAVCSVCYRLPACYRLPDFTPTHATCRFTVPPLRLFAYRYWILIDYRLRLRTTFVTLHLTVVTPHDCVRVPFTACLLPAPHDCTLPCHQRLLPLIVLTTYLRSPFTCCVITDSVLIRCTTFTPVT